MTTATRSSARKAPAAKAASGKKPLIAPLATSVVGSYSVPEWLERLKTDYYQRRISGAYLREIHEVAIKAAIKDQEEADVDVVSDGELRRDNDVDYFLARMPGVEVPQLAKEFYSDYYTAVVDHAIPEPEGDTPALGLVEDFKFTRQYTERPIKFSFTGPFSLSRRVKNEYYKNDTDLVMAIARILNREARELAAAGVNILQIDEPYLAGYPDQIRTAVKAFNTVFEGVDAAKTVRAVHVCYGNRNARPLWEGHYNFLFPAIMQADIDQLVLEFARKGNEDLDLFKRYPKTQFSLGVGVINVKSDEIETQEQVANRVRQALAVLPPDRLMVNPDCGLRNLSSDVARAKLHALTEGTAIVRREVFGK
ncbi:MAG TPA: cobalamin-independent methionine synthase II family protein [Dehalococcoidia bacterium]|jgi:5-methyltetrahydropteroyltriglutamate--homocysteine methyltransferase|nr:cobalamin-independent methionine synthase II family protein [Dehalococcoidia bacterium]